MVLKSKHWRGKLHEIIFEADSFEGKLFDVVLLWAIVISVIAVMLESVSSINILYKEEFNILEWVFTFLFTLEYFARIIALKKPLKYITSFYGIVDLLSILPSYIGIFVSGTHSLMVIRSLRLLRVFRILKLSQFLNESNQLLNALRNSRNKILVFLFAVAMTTIILGTIMYLIEGQENGFTSIPRSIYWAIVTLTTVGYGDIAPQTVLGQAIASLIMIIGYGIIAVPTGIVSAEMVKNKVSTNTQSCPNCGKENHDDDAVFCKYCGSKL
jgi:voltage-gated potassium channel